MTEKNQQPFKKAKTEDRYRMIQWIEKGNIERIQEEIETRGKDFYGAAPLFFAASENNVPALEYFESIGFSLDTRDSGNLSLHFYACRDRGKSEVVSYLLNKNIKPDPKDILEAAAKGKIEILKLYQTFGIDLKDPNLKNENYTLLEIATFSNLECLRFLFEQGLTFEPSLLPRAASLGKLDIVRYLVLEQKANPNVKVYERNAIHEACFGPSNHEPYEHLNILKFLHENGGDLNSPSNWRGDEIYTPLHFACSPGAQDKMPFIRYLLENGVDPDLQNPKSALSIADSKTRKEVLKFLETKGIKVEKDPFQRSFQVDKLIAFAEDAIRKFAKENPEVVVFQFVIEGATMNMSDLFDPDYYIGDWKYEGFAEFGEENGFDYPLWKEHYDSMGEDKNSPYALAMYKVIEGLHEKKAFNLLKRSQNFEAKMIDHMY
ncbi:ankyrin repeat domain-containing protein [Leptospira sp. 201903070]|uniref:Ankyrin repeat domain-containing protein n=1 Tax=Leptospira ainlahdjerensis TaxID=2810033 RepID=A0ABS2UJ52_9LEPT|nr:ankyrin repeat domain-containing protein [Leptospira ainlahdjerensis]MBM9579527.1 ankyrin repeat domain-containing protein [Leptospira ainlahdjerensis]